MKGCVVLHYVLLWVCTHSSKNVFKFLNVGTQLLIMQFLLYAFATKKWWWKPCIPSKFIFHIKPIATVLQNKKKRYSWNCTEKFESLVDGWHQSYNHYYPLIALFYNFGTLNYTIVHNKLRRYGGYKCSISKKTNIKYQQSRRKKVTQKMGQQQFE